MKNKTVLFLIFSLFPLYSFAESTDPADLPFYSRPYSAFSGEEITDEDRDRYLGYLAHPLDLNAAGPDDLAGLPYLSPGTAEALARRLAFKPFESREEAEAWFGAETWERLSPFVALRPPASGSFNAVLSADARAGWNGTNGWSFPGSSLKAGFEGASIYGAAGLSRLPGGLWGTTGTELVAAASGYIGFRGQGWDIFMGGVRFRPLHGAFYASSAADPGLSSYSRPRWRGEEEIRAGSASFSGNGGTDLGFGAGFCLPFPAFGGYAPAPRVSAFAAMDSNRSGFRDAGLSVGFRLPLPLSVAGLTAAAGKGRGTNPDWLPLIAFGLDSSWLPGFTIGCDTAWAGAFAVFPSLKWKSGCWTAGFSFSAAGEGFRPPESAWNRDQGFIGARMEASFRTRDFSAEGEGGFSMVSGGTNLRDRYRMTMERTLLRDAEFREVISIGGKGSYRGSSTERVVSGGIGIRWSGEEGRISAGAELSGNFKLETAAAGWMQMLTLSAVPARGLIISLRGVRTAVAAGGEAFTIGGLPSAGSVPGTESLSGSGWNCGVSAVWNLSEDFRTGGWVSMPIPDGGVVKSVLAWSVSVRL